MALPNEARLKIQSMIKNHEERLDPYRMTTRVVNEIATLAPPIFLTDAQRTELFQYAHSLAMGEERKGAACRYNESGGYL